MIKKSKIILYIFLFELISLVGYVFPDVRQISFLILALLFLIVSIKDLKWGLFILLIELFIGSKGYLFYFEHGDFILSIRIAFWLIIMSIWFTRSIFNLQSSIINFKKILTPYFAIFFLFLGWGLLNGYLRNNELSNVFFDFNNWLYFSLIFPIFSSLKTKEDFKELWDIFLATIIWLSLKTFLLLYFFSHNIPGTIEMLYKWVRTTGVGEITLIEGGFYRIFIQSQIYNLVAFFIFLFLTTKQYFKNKKNKILITYYSLLVINLAIIILNFSRSFWAGLIVGLILFIIFLFWHYNWKFAFKSIGGLILTFILSFVLIVAIVKFPFPNPLGGFSTGDLLKERASQLTDEAAVSSRWNLLPELWSEIKQSPILGQGFGATVTYISNDPRVREQNMTGEYTTYAFEWGWLDIWLKLGLLGALVYIALLLKIIWDGFKLFLNNKENILALSLVMAIIVLCAVHFFTPYLNHPLGIGIILLSASYFNHKLT